MARPVTKQSLHLEHSYFLLPHFNLFLRWPQSLKHKSLTYLKTCTLKLHVFLLENEAYPSIPAWRSWSCASGAMARQGIKIRILSYWFCKTIIILHWYHNFFPMWYGCIKLSIAKSNWFWSDPLCRCFTPFQEVLVRKGFACGWNILSIIKVVSGFEDDLSSAPSETCWGGARQGSKGIKLFSFLGSILSIMFAERLWISQDERLYSWKELISRKACPFMCTFWALFLGL